MTDNDRFNMVGLVIAKRGSGKTLFHLGSKHSSNPKDKALNFRGVIDTELAAGFKCLTVDIMDHPSYKNIPRLKQKDFRDWKTGPARIVIPDPDEIPNLVKFINTQPHFNDSFICFEDAGKYTFDRLPKSFRRLVAETKQRNIDLLFMYHCWKDTPRDVFRKGLDYMQVFKTEDDVSCRQEDISQFEKVRRAYDIVKKHQDIFYSHYVDTRTI